jgi:hypothetical protein
LSSRSGFDINNYVQHLIDDKSDVNNSTAVVYVANHIKACLDFSKSYQHRGFIKKTLKKFFNFFNNGIYLTLCYLFVKMCYVIVIFAQIVALNYWLRDVHYPVTRNLLFGHHNWKLSERFPRMTLCKFQVFIINSHNSREKRELPEDFSSPYIIVRLVE